jgi:hypothetical protein
VRLSTRLSPGPKLGTARGSFYFSAMGRAPHVRCERSLMQSGGRQVASAHLSLGGRFFFGNLHVVSFEQAAQLNVCCISVGSLKSGPTIVIVITPPQLGHGVFVSVLLGSAMGARLLSYRGIPKRHRSPSALSAIRKLAVALTMGGRRDTPRQQVRINGRSP